MLYFSSTNKLQNDPLETLIWFISKVFLPETTFCALCKLQKKNPILILMNENIAPVNVSEGR